MIRAWRLPPLPVGDLKLSATFFGSTNRSIVFSWAVLFLRSVEIFSKDLHLVGGGGCLCKHGGRESPNNDRLVKQTSGKLPTGFLALMSTEENKNVWKMHQPTYA